ncbi:S8 family serine peptidase [Dyadobacter sediminis]|uniref:Peptidase S8 n=1 Tax=Dyadobacter sediminis TaxID=1493691 RepID=A0A5R9KE74_9BACT|nr:S8 family serine peptidase [Dyadobacter sediminis]TLU94419.1 peptidase S8 [Dyadobacter sediminis]GGB91414.1 serine protease [Dyadobacter sediminis]
MKKFLLLAFTFLPCILSASPKYWIYLKNKDQNAAPAVSMLTMENRQKLGLVSADETDLPVKREYEVALQNESVKIINRSRWLNAVSATLTSEQAMKVRQLDFVQEVVPIDPGFYIARMQPVEKAQMAPVMSQVQANVFLKEGITAKDVTIGVIDAGFYGADSSMSLTKIFSNNRILGIRDYVKPGRPGNLLFSTAESFSDMHGTEVLAAISGMDYKDQMQYGMAINAKFYLARTDYSLREYRGEEDNWIAAMEWMDSLGVRLINTSLGYAKGFSDPKENYVPSQMDGKTSAITRAAQIASDKKGIMLIVSAGNEGEDKSWEIISAPADAQGVLAVGATNGKLWNRIGYSSTGPEFLPYVKPNVSCFSLYGTSLSAPVITGFAACLLQANPNLTNKELLSLIEKSAHLYPYGNNYVGYGVPLASRALALAKAPYLPNNSRLVTASGRTCEIEVVSPDSLVAIYRKKNDKDVLSQQVGKIQNGRISLKRQNGERFTTIDLKDSVVEVQWN